MANITNIPLSFGGGGDDVLNPMLIELLRDLSLNKNLFTTDLSDEEDKEILEAYGYEIHEAFVKFKDGCLGNIPVAFPKGLSERDVQKKLKKIKTPDDAYEYYPKVVLERENRKLYVKLLKKLIDDCNS